MAIYCLLRNASGTKACCHLPGQAWGPDDAQNTPLLHLPIHWTMAGTGQMHHTSHPTSVAYAFSAFLSTGGCHLVTRSGSLCSCVHSKHMLQPLCGFLTTGGCLSAVANIAAVCTTRTSAPAAACSISACFNPFVDLSQKVDASRQWQPLQLYAQQALAPTPSAGQQHMQGTQYRDLCASSACSTLASYRPFKGRSHEECAHVRSVWCLWPPDQR